MHPDITPATKEKILDWMFSRDTGMSSKALAAFFIGQTRETSYPHDPDDFGRCYRMLKCVPELRPHIAEAGAISPAWKELVGAWDELEAMYEQFCDTSGRRIDKPGFAEAKKMYVRMQELTSKPSTDEGWIHLNGVSMKVRA